MVFQDLFVPWQMRGFDCVLFICLPIYYFHDLKGSTNVFRSFCHEKRQLICFWMGFSFITVMFVLGFALDVLYPWPYLC